MDDIFDVWPVVENGQVVGFQPMWTRDEDVETMPVTEYGVQGSLEPSPVDPAAMVPVVHRGQEKCWFDEQNAEWNEF